MLYFNFFKKARIKKINSKLKKAKFFIAYQDY